MTNPRGSRRRTLGTLRLVREGSFLAPDGYPNGDIRCDSPRSVFQFMQPYAEREEVEVFWILALDAQMKIIRNLPLTVTRGILNSAPVHPREVFRLAIHANAASIIAVHNHPSGDPTPSPEDRAITDQLAAAGRTIGIPLYDHIIVGAGRYVSFAESGFL
jgi:DNA repair protein RadC